jgi:hypothetical protein
MQTKGKFLMQTIGINIKYRLDLIRRSYPKAKDYIICLTTRESYEMYKDHHDFFTFLIIDDYRKDYPISLEHETFPSYKTETEFFREIKSFYGHSTGKFFSYDIHRFTFPYLIENGILNFAFIDTDFVLNEDPKLIEEFFERVPEKACYAPWFGEDLQSKELKSKFWLEEIQPNFPQIKLESPFIRNTDGFVRGFNFDTVENMKLVYDLWNTALDKIYTIPLYQHHLCGNNGAILHTEWVIAHIMQFLEYQLGYSFLDCHGLFMIDGKRVGKHITRVEDTIYLGPRPQWSHFNFDYSDISTISNFIKNNKEQLHQYYLDKFPEFEITDTHVYTKIESYE